MKSDSDAVSRLLGIPPPVVPSAQVAEVLEVVPVTEVAITPPRPTPNVPIFAPMPPPAPVATAGTNASPSVASIAPSQASCFSAESFDWEGERVEVTGGDYSTRFGHRQARIRKKDRSSANPDNESTFHLDIRRVRREVREKEQREQQTRSNQNQN